MTFRNLICLPLLGLLFLPPAHAVVIIDATTLNGSFESGTLDNADNWTALTGYTEERLENNASDGSWSAVMGFDDRTNPDPTIFWGIEQDTGHTVSTGETYDLSFDWIPKYNWRESDEFEWELFTDSGSIATGTVSGSANGAAYQTVSLTGIGTVAAPSVGESLQISFKTVDPGSYPNDPQGFARIDNVQLTAIPEPSTLALALVMLGVGGAFRLRRRG
jgi:hypothetical protein